MLHLIFQAPIETAVLERMASGDVAVFLESAVFGVLKKGAMADVLVAKLNTIRMYVMADDLATRGIQEGELIPGMGVIDYPGLVNLTVENPLNTSWC